MHCEPQLTIVYTYSFDDSAPDKVYGPLDCFEDAEQWGNAVFGEDTDELSWYTRPLTLPVWPVAAA